MKKNLFLFIATVLLALSMSSCKETGNYQQAIPANASMVVVINAKQLIDKADLSETTKNQLIKVLKDGLDAKSSAKIARFLENPETAGISMTDPLLGFGQLGNKEVGFVAKVKNKSQLDELFSTLQSEGVSTPPAKKDSYTEIIINKLVLAYNDNTFLLIFADDSVEKGQQSAATYMTQSKEQSIVLNENFQKIIHKGSDFSCFYSGNIIQEAVKFSQTIPNTNQTLHVAAYPDSATLSQLEIIANVNFEQGNIKGEFDCAFQTKEALEKYLSTLPFAHKQKDISINRFPASTLIYSGMNINGEKFYKYMAPNIEKLPFAKQVNLEKLLQSINGDFSVGLTQLGAMGIPSILMYAEVKDDYPLTFIHDQLKDKLPLTPNGKDSWKAVIPMLNMNLFFGIENKLFYFTNDADLYARIGKAAEKPLGDTPQGKNMKNSYAYTLINFGEIAQLPILDLLFKQMGTKGELVKNTLNGCDYMESYNSTETSSSMNFYLKNKNQNSLKTITSGIEEYLPMFMPKN